MSSAASNRGPACHVPACSLTNFPCGICSRPQCLIQSYTVRRGRHGVPDTGIHSAKRPTLREVVVASAGEIARNWPHPECMQILCRRWPLHRACWFCDNQVPRLDRQRPQALRDPGVVRDAVKLQPAPRNAHDVKPTLVQGAHQLCKLRNSVPLSGPEHACQEHKRASIAMSYS